MTTPNNTAVTGRNGGGRPVTDTRNGTSDRSPSRASQVPARCPAPAGRLASRAAACSPRRRCLLLLLAAAQGYVSFRAQYAFVDHAKRAQVPSILEALGLDTGAVIFALLALSLARRGRRGTVERVLNVACALGSLTMNLLAANLTSPRSITVWVLPSALYALASDRLIAVVRRWVQASDPAAQLAQEGSAWRAFGGLALWVLRLIFDVRGTVAGFRRWVLAVAPVAPGTRAVTPPAAGELPALPLATTAVTADQSAAQNRVRQSSGPARSGRPAPGCLGATRR